MESEKKVVEINGIKMELDYRSAKMQKIDLFKVGDPVKLLRNEGYGTPQVFYGVIVGFDNFKLLPSIEVAYLDSSELKFVLINTGSKHEIVATDSHDLTASKDWIMNQLDRKVAQKEMELVETEAKRTLFLDLFGKYMGPLDSEQVSS